MSRRYADERGSGTITSENLATSAAFGDLEVYFILAAAAASPVFFEEPSEDTVVGYVALRRELPHMGAEEIEEGASVMLVQVYVEPECRSRGYATSAMRVLLAKSSVVAMARSVPVMCRMLSRLGFTDGFSQFTTEEPASDDEFGNALPCTFYRTIPCTE
jgi:GNAT superfamily N-acetyltransferase